MSNKSKTIAEKMETLRELVAWFESDDFQLEEALDRYEAVELLSKEIDTELQEFKNKITVLKNDFSKDS